jgi:CBS-domain-containing membrane protein
MTDDHSRDERAAERQAERAAERQAERAAEAITQSTHIADLSGVLRRTEATVVHAGDSLQRLAEMVVERPQCRVVSVVDDRERLIGLVPIRTLVNDIFLKIVPEEFLGEITDLDAVMRYAGHLQARTAADIMVEPTSVEPQETLRDAFERMHHADLNGLPVVDTDHRVLGYLDQLELLLAWVQATGRGAMLRPPAPPAS